MGYTRGTHMYSWPQPIHLIPNFFAACFHASSFSGGPFGVALIFLKLSDPPLVLFMHHA